VQLKPVLARKRDTNDDHMIVVQKKLKDSMGSMMNSVTEDGENMTWTQRD